MKCGLIFWILTFFLLGSIVRGEYRDFTDNWFDQTLDHFDPTNNRTFKERYWFNDEYFDQSNRTVIFLSLSGEDELFREWMTNGTLIGFAKYFKGLFVALENRYFGKSSPFNNYTVDNLKFLTTPQSVEDIANFIDNVKIPNNTFVHKPQWIIYAGSYPGNLAAYSRLNFPHLIKGVVVSSAPFETNIVIPEYMNTVADDIKLTSKKCYDIIGEGFAEIEKLIKTSAGRATLTKELNLCTPLNETSDNYELQDVSVQLQIDYQGLAQSNLVNRMSYESAEQRTNNSLNHICFIITNNSTNKSSLARVNDVAQFLRNGDCLDYGFKEYVSDISNTSNTDRPLWWLRCTEWGNIQIPSINGSSKIFGSLVQVQYYTDQCSAIFGKWLDVPRQQAGLQHIVRTYGARQINITNAVFIYGTWDPWSKLGLQKSNNKNSPVIIINGTSHAADMFPAASDDPQGLTNARRMARNLVASWLSN